MVAAIDVAFRTDARPEARGLAGFSMGGYGVLSIGLENPDVFSVVFANGPPLLLDEDFAMAMDSWNLRHRRAYGAVFAPKDGEAQIPQMDGSAEDAEIINLWLTGFGDMEEKIEAYLRLESRLSSLRIDYGSTNDYPWLRNGCDRFSELLTEAGIEHDFVVQNRGHSMSPEILRNQMLPFFRESFGE